MRIISVTLNPAFDKHCYTHTFTPFQENFFTITQTISGGKGINLSRALIRYGYTPLTYVVTGKDNEDAFLRQLQTDNVPCTTIATQGVIRENVTLHSSAQKETRISFNGFTGSDGLLNEVFLALQPTVTEGDLIAVMGSFFEGISQEAKLGFIQKLTNLGAKIIIDSRSFTLDDLLLVRPYFIKPNEQEISLLFNRAVDTEEDIVQAVQELLRRGICNVMVTLGERGGILGTNEGIYKAEVPQIPTLSTIGAGDSSIAGFLYGVAHGYPVENCFAHAMAFGSAACMTEGTLPPTRQDITSILQQIRVIKILER